MFSDVDTVIFDLDGTLLDRRLSFDGFVRDQWARFRGELDRVDVDEYARILIALDADGYGPRKALFSGLTAQFALPADLGARLLADYRERFPAACVLFPDAVETLSVLRTSGFRLGLITNGSLRMQSRKLHYLALAPSFDAVLISDAEGISKPAAAIFHRAVERLDTESTRAVFVGDHPEVDIQGARGAGLHTIWRRDPTWDSAVHCDATIDQVADILALLGVQSH